MSEVLNHDELLKAIVGNWSLIQRQLLKNMGKWPDRYQISEDLAQEAVIKAVSKADTFRNDCALTSWMYRIAHNHFLDYLRRHRRHDLRLRSLEEVLVESEEGGGPISLEDMLGVDHTEDGYNGRLDVPRFLSTLDLESQHLVLLWMEGRTFQEMAGIHFVKLSTAKTRLFRALDRIRAANGINS